MEAILEDLAKRSQDVILTLHSGDEWAVSIYAKGRPVVNYFPARPGPAGPTTTAGEELLAYVDSRTLGETEVEVFEETRVTPASDAGRVGPETQHHLSQLYLPQAVSMETTLPLPVEAAPQPDVGEATEAPPAVAPLEIVGPEVPVEDLAAPARTAPAPEAAGPAPEVLLFLGDHHLATFSLARGELTVGRNPANDIVVENAGVSRRHAVIRWSGDQVSVEDLKSANGTFVSGKKITTQDLNDGDEITIVKHRLVLRVPKDGNAVNLEPQEISGQRTMFIDPTAVAQAVAGRAGARGESSTPVLRPFLILPGLKKVALEAEGVTLGSGSECSVQLSGMFVAKVHARIVLLKEGQYKIVHVAGLAGTRVNGEKITERVLKHGDEIGIGKSRLLYRIER